MAACGNSRVGTLPLEAFPESPVPIPWFSSPNWSCSGPCILRYLGTFLWSVVGNQDPSVRRPMAAILPSVLFASQPHPCPWGPQEGVDERKPAVSHLKSAFAPVVGHQLITGEQGIKAKMGGQT